MPTWLVKMVVAFVIRQLVKYGAKINWALVKQDLGARIADLVPGTFFDAQAQALAFAALDVIARCLRSTTEIEKILTLLAQGKPNEAIDRLKDLVLSQGVGETDPEKVFLAHVAEKPASLHLQLAA